MLDLKTELAEVMAALVVTGRIESSNDVLYSAAQKFNKICYVTINRPYHTFSGFFEVNKIDPQKFFFIDCITKSVVGKTHKNNGVIFVSSPNDFEGIEKKIRQVLQKQKIDLLIFDSLSSLLIFEKGVFVTKFIHGLAAMIKGFQGKSVFIALEKDAGLDMAKKIGMLMDKTIYVI